MVHNDVKSKGSIDMKGLKNAGRYYLAKIVEKNGTAIDEVLVDKQSGTIQSLRRRIGSGELER